MTAGLGTFAKVRALHDSTASPGEKASAAARMKTLARKAGMTVEEAVSKLDTPPVTIVASCTVDAAEAFNAFFNTPQMRAERAEREARRQTEAAAIIERHGSEAALFADTPLEAALRAACEPLLGPGETWRTIYRLDGWGALSPDRDMPATVRSAVSEAWPLPVTVAQAWAEYEASEVRIRDRYTVDVHCDPEVYVRARQHVLAGLLDTLPARSMNDARARLSWLEFWPGIEVEQDSASLRATLATLRADIERMGQRLRGQDAGAATNPLEEGQCSRGAEAEAEAGVQSGHGQGSGRPAPYSPAASGTSAENPADCPAPVQSGHPHRTNADKRRDALGMLGLGLTDREIARRVGVSPTTVGTIRKICLSPTHENGGAHTPPLSPNSLPAAPSGVGILLGSHAHQHAGRASDSHREAAQEGADHRVGEALQDHVVHSFHQAAGPQPDPVNSSAIKMPDRPVACGAKSHAAPRNNPVQDQS